MNLVEITVRVKKDGSGFAAVAAEAKAEGDKAGKNYSDSLARRLSGAGKGGLIATGLAAALAAGPVVGAAAGAATAIAFGAKMLIGTKASQGPLYGTWTSFLGNLKGTFMSAAQPLMQPLKDAFSQVGGILKQIEPELKAVFGNAGALIQPLVSGVGQFVKNFLPGFAAFLKNSGPAVQALGGALGLVGTALGQMLAKLNMKDAAAAFTNIANAVVGLIPLVGALANVATALFAHMSPGMIQGLAVAFLALWGAVKLLAVADAVATGAQIALDAAMDANPIGLVVLAIAALAIGIYELIKHWNKVKAVTIEVWHAIEFAVGHAVGGILSFVKMLGDAVLSAVGHIVGVLAKIPGPQQSMMRKLEGTIKSGTATFNSALNGAIKTVDNLGKHMAKPKIQKLQANMTDLNAKLASARRQLADPNLTKTRRAALEARIGQLLAAKAAAQRAINSLRGRTVFTTLVTRHITENILTQARSINNLFGNRAHGGTIGTAATGGIRHGLTIVGEHGAEAVRLPTGSTVMSNPDTERMMSGAHGGAAKVVVEVRSSGKEIDELLAKLMRKYIRSHGGNVQTVLGH